MFQTKVLATAVAALVASTNVVEAQRKEDRANHRSETKNEFIYTECKVEDLPYLKGVVKLRQNEEGDFEVDESDSSDCEGEGLFSITLDNDPVCSLNNFSGKPFRVGYNSMPEHIQSHQSSFLQNDLLGHKIAISKLGDAVMLTDGKAMACC